jgi:25S rRNA (uracil2634-N3)-methyltransferase
MAKGLRRALLTLQAKGYKQERAKALQAAKQQQAKQKAAGNKPRNNRTPKKNKRYAVPFNQEDSILLLGEGTISIFYKLTPMTKGGYTGDFSFAQSLIDVHQLPPSNITATTFDSAPECYAKYERSKATVHHLRQNGVTTLFGVDATKLGAIKKLRGKTWTKIVWNFPHAGAVRPAGLDSTTLLLYVGKGITDQDRNILSNQGLLLGFFKSAAPFLRHGPSNDARNRKIKHSDNEDDNIDEMVDIEGDIDGVSEDENGAPVTQAESHPIRGTILVTLRDKPPYTLW